MNLLLFSDIHGSKKACKNIAEQAPKADILIGAGDFGNMRRGIIQTIERLKAIEQPTVLVPGNAESYEELQDACQGWKQATVLHGNGTELNGIPFYGIGGGIPVTPFGPWSYDFSEEEARTLLADLPENAVLVSHSPPKGVVDVSSSGQSLGSTAIREAILEKQPRLVVCGHIHESDGQTGYLNDTPVVNAGPKGVRIKVSSTKY